MKEQETFYTITTPDGDTHYFYGETMFDAFTEALENYGTGITIRPSWYGEWDCGTQELAELYGGCYYDKYGNHHKAKKVSA